MSDLTKRTNDLEEAKKQLRRTSSLRELVTKATAKRTALALDCSGSMSLACQNGVSRAENLRAAIKDLPQMPTITFGMGVLYHESQLQADTTPNGGTPMAEALRAAMDNGCSHVILVTDGEPNNPQACFIEAADMKIEAIYIADPPIPQFLITLTGNQVNNVNPTSFNFTKELEAAVRGFLEGSAK